MYEPFPSKISKYISSAAQRPMATHASSRKWTVYITNACIS